MASPRFLLKTDLQGLEPAMLGGAPVLEAYPRLLERLGPHAALFAEPVVTWGNGRNAGSVSWYAEGSGDPVPLAGLAPPRRQAAEAELARRLAALEHLAGDPLLRAALVLAGPDSILVLDDQPRLTGWGLAPSGALRDAAGRAAQLRAVYGAALPPAFLAEPASPDATLLRPPPQPPPQAAPPPRPLPVGAQVAPPAAAAAATPAPARVGSAWNWWLVPTGLLIAAIFLGLGFWLGWTLVAERVGAQRLTAHLADEDRVRAQIARQREANEALRREIEQVRTVMAGDVCRPGDSPLPPLTPPVQVPVQPSAVPPPPGGAQTFTGTLLDLLDQATVLVLGPQQDGIGTGTGFVVAPGFVLTNAHVIAAIEPGRLFVVNRRLGRPMRVEIAARTEQPRPGVPDFALLRLPADAPALQPLGFARSAARLDAVIAAGFPQAIMQTDANFRALLDGNMTAIPELAVTDGLISAVQTLPSGLVVMPHTAAISRGNSGGPLVDRCGRVLGVNTFGFFNAEQGERVSYAQKTETILAFLAQNGVNATELTGACQPPPLAVPAAVQAPGPAAPAPSPSAPAGAPGAAPTPAPSGTPAAPGATPGSSASPPAAAGAPAAPAAPGPATPAR